MTFAIVFLIALVVAFLRNHGRFVTNRAIRLRGLVLIFVALLLQIAEVYWLGFLSRFERAMLLGISLICLAIVVLLNRRYWAVNVLGLGLALNGLVMVVNGGFMPISPETLVQTGRFSSIAALPVGTLVARSKDVLLLPGQTRLWFLSDIFPIPMPVGIAFSIGDVFVAIGLFVLVQQLFSRHRPTGRALSVASASPIHKHGEAGQQCEDSIQVLSSYENKET
jgi:hypothetical protein